MAPIARGLGSRPVTKQASSTSPAAFPLFEGSTLAAAISIVTYLFLFWDVVVALRFVSRVRIFSLSSSHSGSVFGGERCVRSSDDSVATQRH